MCQGGVGSRSTEVRWRMTQDRHERRQSPLLEPTLAVLPRYFQNNAHKEQKENTMCIVALAGRAHYLPVARVCACFHVFKIIITQEDAIATSCNVIFSDSHEIDRNSGADL